MVKQLVNVQNRKEMVTMKTKEFKAKLWLHKVVETIDALTILVKTVESFLPTDPRGFLIETGDTRRIKAVRSAIDLIGYWDRVLSIFARKHFIERRAIDQHVFPWYNQRA